MCRDLQHTLMLLCTVHLMIDGTKYKLNAIINFFKTILQFNKLLCCILVSDKPSNSLFKLLLKVEFLFCISCVTGAWHNCHKYTVLTLILICKPFFSKFVTMRPSGNQRRRKLLLPCQDKIRHKTLKCSHNFFFLQFGFGTNYTNMIWGLN